MQEIILVILAYLLGSIPTAVWVSKYFFNIDIRNYGSGNAGATNTLRVLGSKAGAFVFAIDMIKGFPLMIQIWKSKWKSNFIDEINLRINTLKNGK